MADVGLSPYDVLRTSTYKPALYPGELKEFGTVEVGKRADLILLESNPPEDITNTRQIAGTMVCGHWYSRTDLDLMLDAVEDAKAGRAAVKAAFPTVVVLALAGQLGFIFLQRQYRSA